MRQPGGVDSVCVPLAGLLGCRAMNPLVRLSLGCVLLSSAVSCTIPKPTPGGHPGVAMLYTEPAEPFGWNSHQVWVQVEKVDDKRPTFTKTLGVTLSPGPHKIDLNMSTPSDDPMVFGGGLIGALVAELGKAAGGPRQQSLSLNARDGCDYVARHSNAETGRGHVYWVEQYPGNAVVAGSRPTKAGPMRSPFLAPSADGSSR